MVASVHVSEVINTVYTYIEQLFDEGPRAVN